MISFNTENADVLVECFCQQGAFKKDWVLSRSDQETIAVRNYRVVTEVKENETPHRWSCFMEKCFCLDNSSGNSFAGTLSISQREPFCFYRHFE